LKTRSARRIPTPRGVRGKEGASSFWDNSIGLTTIRITCEETFPSSSPDEIAHILQLCFSFDNGSASAVRGIFTYKVNDAGLLINLRGYWKRRNAFPALWRTPAAPRILPSPTR
jgi:steroid delta-isomerase